MEDVLKKRKAQKKESLDGWMPEKEKLALRFIDEVEAQKSRNMVVGSVHMCQLGENIGSEQNDERPVIIVSNDRINSTSTNVKIVPLSKRLKFEKKKNRKGKIVEVPIYRTHYFLRKSKYPFLNFNSAVKCEEVTTVSKIRIGKHLGNIDPTDMDRIKSRIKWVFEL